MTKTGVTLTGHGTAAGVPSEAVLRLAAEATGVGVADAVRSAGEALSVMRAALVDQGVSEVDLRSTAASVSPNYGRNGPRGYIARFGLDAVLRDAIAVGTCAQAAVDAGGDNARLDALSYRHSNPVQLRADARAAAFADASAKAEQLAGLAGRQLGSVEEVIELEAGGPGPMPMRAMAADVAELAFAPGEQEIAVVLTVRWSWA